MLMKNDKYRKEGENMKQELEQKVLFLSAQERKVFLLIIEGKSNKEIANQLFISLSTVKTHVHNILKKLNAIRRTEVINNINSLNWFRQKKINLFSTLLIYFN